MLNIDRLDVQLIGLLTRDARMGIVQLASTLGVARNTVQARLTRLEAARILTGFTPQIDLEAAGVSVRAFIALELVQGRLKKVVEELTTFPEVLEIHATTGREDLLVQVATATQAGLQRLIEAVVSVPGVAHSSTRLSLTAPLVYRVQPLLENLSDDDDWGRATPSADN